MSESFAALFEESLKRTEMRPGEVITAEVVRIEHSFVVVNAGLKSEAYVPLEEFKNDQGETEVQVGDFVSVAIGSIENGYGDTILSRDTAKRLASWMSLEKALETGEFVTGTTSGKVKGGLTVLVNGIRAFLPGSLVDTRPTKDLSPYENKTLEFKVIKLDRKRNNVVVSRRAVLEASSVKSAKHCCPTSRKAVSSRVSSRTSPTTVHSLTLAVSMACCTLLTWPGAVSVTRLKSWPSATK
jgi:small subunit ribosomal protein S1